MDDDDGPPMLVSSSGAGNEDASLNAGAGDVKPTKVPISIITGQLEIFHVPIMQLPGLACLLQEKRFIRSVFVLTRRRLLDLLPSCAFEDDLLMNAHGIYKLRYRSPCTY